MTLAEAPDRAVRSVHLDMLRGVAVVLVMLRHAWPETFPGAGVVGVVMFFTLSGFLITDSLRREWQQHGRIAIAEFFWRRAARLVPALLLLVVAVVIVTLVWDPLEDRDILLTTVAIALTWTANVPFFSGSAATFHLWTLALEEQFYLVWPWVLVAALRMRRTAIMIAVAVALCLVGAIATMVWLHESPDVAYALPTPWAVALVIGAALAVVPALGRGARVAPWWWMSAACVLAVLAFVPMRGHVVTYVAAAPVIAAASLVLIRDAHARRHEPARLTRLVASIGVVSYAAYLWNYPLTLWLRPTLHEWAGPIAMVLTLVAAWASYRVVEEPARRAIMAWRARARGRRAEVARV